MDNNLNYTDSKSEMEKNFLILKTYFNKWKKVKKEKTLSQNGYEDKIHDFLELILKQKEKLNECKKNNSYLKSKKWNENKNMVEMEEQIIETKMKNCLKQNEKIDKRFQIQTHTIALLKAQLEQKNRVIEELKLKKIVEDSNITNDVVNDLKKSFTKCSISMKPKMKCIIGEPSLNSSNSEEEFKVHCVKVPKFLQQMEQRARQREEKRKVVAERRKQIEFEKEKLKEQMLLEKQLKDQEERVKIIHEFKEKHKREKLLAIKRKEFIEKLRSLCVMADLHFEKKLMCKYGIVVWKLYVQKVKEDYQNAVNFDTKRLVRHHFNLWSKKVNDAVQKKNLKADNMYNNKLKTFMFKEIKKSYKNMLNKLYTAEDWYVRFITDKLLNIWRENTDHLKRFRKIQWNIATLHYEKWLKWKVIGCWQTFPTIMALEREHQSRKQRWRVKVRQVLPDFFPREMD